MVEQNGDYWWQETEPARVLGALDSTGVLSGPHLSPVRLADPVLAAFPGAAVGHHLVGHLQHRILFLLELASIAENAVGGETVGLFETAVQVPCQDRPPAAATHEILSQCCIVLQLD